MRVPPTKDPTTHPKSSMGYGNKGKSFTPPEFSLSSGNMDGQGYQNQWDQYGYEGFHSGDAESAWTYAPSMGGPEAKAGEEAYCEDPQVEAEAAAKMAGEGGYTEMKSLYEPGSEESKWDQFSVGFNDEFKSILHVFAAQANPDQLSSPAESPKMVGKGKTSGDLLDGFQLSLIFTEKQRDLLMEYFSSHTIPDRLFNGDEIGTASPQQRILMSAEIMANGTYSPGAFEQGVHAKNCGHWVNVVQNYAGVVSHNGSNANSINGNFDLEGNVIMGANNAEQVFKGKRVYNEDLPEKESKTLGPIYSGTAHGDASDKKVKKGKERDAKVAELKAQAAQEGRELDSDDMPKSVRQSWRNEHLGFERFGELQPGDWLYIYNANGSGNHSVIFSRWASGANTLEGTDIQYRKAITYDQGSPDSGGKEHQLNLGSQFHRTEDISISPITLVSRVNSDAKQATEVSELLPERGAKGEGKLETSNAKFIKSVEKKYKGTFDMDGLFDQLRSENEGHITALDDRLTKGQKKLLQKANASTDLETLVRLTQRLRQLHTNADILKRNTDKTFAGKYDAKHAEEEAEYLLVKTTLTTELEGLAAEKKPLAEDLKTKSDRREALDTYAEIKELREELKRIKNLEKTDEEYADRKRLRKEVIDKITVLKEIKAENKDEFKALRSEINALKKQIGKIDGKTRKVEDKLAKATKALPYGMVAEGGKKGQDSRKLSASNTGNLASLFKIENLKHLVK